MTSPVTAKHEPGSDVMEHDHVPDRHSFKPQKAENSGSAQWEGMTSNRLDSQSLCTMADDDTACQNLIPTIKSEQAMEQDAIGNIHSQMLHQSAIESNLRGEEMQQHQVAMSEAQQTLAEVMSVATKPSLQITMDSGIDHWLCFAEIMYKCKLCSSLPSYQTSKDGFLLHMKDEHLTKHVSFVECTSCTLMFRTVHDLRVHVNAGTTHHLCNKSIVTGSALTTSEELDLRMRNSTLNCNIELNPRTVISPVTCNLPNVVNRVVNNSVALDSMLRGNSALTSGKTNESLTHLQQLTDQISTVKRIQTNLPYSMPLHANIPVLPNVSFTPGFGLYTKIVREGGNVCYFCQVCNYASSMKQSFVQHCMGVNHQIKVHRQSNHDSKQTEAGPLDCTISSEMLSDSCTNMSNKCRDLTESNSNKGTNSPSTCMIIDSDGTRLETIKLLQEKADRMSPDIPDSDCHGNIEHHLAKQDSVVSDLTCKSLVIASNSINQRQINLSEIPCTGYTIDATDSPSPAPVSGSSRRKRAPVRRLLSDAVWDLQSSQDDRDIYVSQNNSSPLSKKVKIGCLSPIMSHQKETEENMDDSKKSVVNNLSTSSVYGSCETLVSQSTVGDDYNLNSPAVLPVENDIETYNIYARLSNNILNSQLNNNSGSKNDSNNNNNNNNNDNSVQRFPHYNINYRCSENKAMYKTTNTGADIIARNESTVEDPRAITPPGNVVVQSVSQATCGEFKCTLCSYTYSDFMHYQHHFETVHMVSSTKGPNERDYEAWKVTKIRDCLPDLLIVCSHGNVSRELLLMRISLLVNDSGIIHWGPACNRAVREQFPESVAQRKGKYKNTHFFGISFKQIDQLNETVDDESIDVDLVSVHKLRDMSQDTELLMAELPSMVYWTGDLVYGISRDELLGRLHDKLENPAINRWGVECNRAIRALFPMTQIKRKGKYKITVFYGVDYIDRISMSKDDAKQNTSCLNTSGESGNPVFESAQAASLRKHTGFGGSNKNSDPVERVASGRLPSGLWLDGDYRKRRPDLIEKSATEQLKAALSLYTSSSSAGDPPITSSSRSPQTWHRTLSPAMFPDIYGLPPERVMEINRELLLKTYRDNKLMKSPTPFLGIQNDSDSDDLKRAVSPSNENQVDSGSVSINNSSINDNILISGSTNTDDSNHSIDSTPADDTTTGNHGDVSDNNNCHSDDSANPGCDTVDQHDKLKHSNDIQHQPSDHITGQCTRLDSTNTDDSSNIAEGSHICGQAVLLPDGLAMERGIADSVPSSVLPSTSLR